MMRGVGVVSQSRFQRKCFLTGAWLRTWDHDHRDHRSDDDGDDDGVDDHRRGDDDHRDRRGDGDGVDHYDHIDDGHDNCSGIMVVDDQKKVMVDNYPRG